MLCVRHAWRADESARSDGCRSARNEPLQGSVGWEAVATSSPALGALAEPTNLGRPLQCDLVYGRRRACRSAVPLGTLPSEAQPADHSMPGLDGFGVLHYLRRDGVLDDAPLRRVILGLSDDGGRVEIVHLRNERIIDERIDLNAGLESSRIALTGAQQKILGGVPAIRVEQAVLSISVGAKRLNLRIEQDVDRVRIGELCRADVLHQLKCRVRVRLSEDRGLDQRPKESAQEWTMLLQILRLDQPRF